MELAQFPGAPRRAQAGSAAGLLAASSVSIGNLQTAMARVHIGAVVSKGHGTCAGRQDQDATLPDGTSIKVGHDVGLVTLRRVMTVLRR